MAMVKAIKAYFLFLLIPMFAQASEGWVVNCENWCGFQEFPNNCQGVYYEYADGLRSYSSHSSTYNGCLEVRYFNGWDTHVLSHADISCSCAPATGTVPAEAAPLSSETKKTLERLREQIRGWALCAPDPALPVADIYKPFKFTDLKTCEYYKSKNLKSYYVTLNWCTHGESPWEYDCKYDGDTLVTASWMCDSGDEDRCNDIMDAQDPVTGAWYRNGFYRRNPHASTGQPLFSRDHTLGVIGYLIHSKNKVAAEKWLNFVKNNEKHNGFYSICPARPAGRKPKVVSAESWAAMLPSDACDVRPELWGLIYRAMKYVGFTDAELLSISADIHNSMLLGVLIDDVTLEISAATVPAKGSDSFQASLVADTVELRKKIGDDTEAVQNAITTINERTSKLSPRVHWLANDKTPTEYGAYLIQKYCKVPAPPYGVWATNGNSPGIGFGNESGIHYRGLSLDQGKYQFVPSYDNYGSYFYPTGLECIGWMNLYLQNSEKKYLACDPEETLIDGACQTVAFPKPNVPPVLGAGYQLNYNWISYQMIDRQFCPWGMAHPAVGDPNWWDPIQNRCWLDNLSIPNGVLKVGKTYWIYTDAFTPGVYTALNASGSCDAGETPLLGACRVFAFTLPTPNLYNGVTYWVDQNPAAPGVYYAKVDGACPYGGTISGSSCKLYAASAGKLKAGQAYFVRRNPKYPGIYHYPSVRTTPLKNIVGPAPEATGVVVRPPRTNPLTISDETLGAPKPPILDTGSDDDTHTDIGGGL